MRRLDETTFERLRDAWDDLLARSPADTVFLTWEWLHSWWQSFGGGKTLLLLAVEEPDGMLVGLAPLCVTTERLLGVVPLRVVRFLGVERVSSEYLDLIADEGRAEAVVEAVVDFLARHAGTWDVVVLSDMRESARNLLLLRAALARHGLRALLRAGQTCPHIALPATHEAFRATLSGNMRYHLNRRQRGLRKLGTLRLVRCDDAAAALRALDDLFDLHGARWTMRGRAGNFQSPAVRGFHRTLVPRLARRGWLRFRLLTLDGKPIAALYGFGYRGTYSYYQSGFRPEAAPQSPGVVLMGLCIEEAISDGFREFDYLRGDESYKWNWTASSRRTVTMWVHRRGAASRLSAWQGQLRDVLRGLRRLAGRVPGLARPGAARS